ncbi:MAG: hypothetical protein Q7U12_10875, partial [Undibacterium sp.]|nr:hypothetical protein [Undibacterium sp.]
IGTIGISQQHTGASATAINSDQVLVLFIHFSLYSFFCSFCYYLFYQSGAAITSHTRFIVTVGLSEVVFNRY